MKHRQARRQVISGIGTSRLSGAFAGRFTDVLDEVSAPSCDDGRQVIEVGHVGPLLVQLAERANDGIWRDRDLRLGAAIRV